MYGSCFRFYSQLIASQAIFFATHVLLLTAAKPVNSRMLPFVATITCLLIGGSIWDAALATHRLARKAKDRREQYNLTEDDVRELAKPVGETGLQLFALLVP